MATNNGMIQRAAKDMQAAPEKRQQAGVMAAINEILDGNKMRKRFDELLGKRTPQFIGSLVSLINADVNLQEAMHDAPMTVVQSALKAATFDLPIDPSLGFAYIVPFRNGKTGKREAQFILGYKGMTQLCLRTGAYRDIPTATDVREGELVSNDRLRGPEFRWIEDDEEREKLPIIGYAAHLALKNGASKDVYWSKAKVEAHERKNRKGQYQGKGWRDDWNAMACKTVLRNLITHYGLLSIDYQQGDPETVRLAQAVMEDEAETDGGYEIIQDIPVDESTGEVQEDFPEFADGAPGDEQLPL